MWALKPYSFQFPLFCCFSIFCLLNRTCQVLVSLCPVKGIYSPVPKGLKPQFSSALSLPPPLVPSTSSLYEPSTVNQLQQETPLGTEIALRFQGHSFDYRNNSVQPICVKLQRCLPILEHIEAWGCDFN